jgi:hypothetical protein
MARPGTSKIDFYPDEEVQELLKNLPPNTRSATLNNLVKAYLSPDLTEREDAEAMLAEIIRRRNNTSKSRYAGSFVDTANLLQAVFIYLCKKHNIEFFRESARYGTVKLSQALREFNIAPDDENLTENVLVQSAFFKTVGEMRFWQSQLAVGLREDEVHIFAEKWKSGHPPLHDGRIVIIEIGTGTADQAISQFVYEIKDHYLDKGQPFVCRWLEDGETKERHLAGR